MSKPIFSGKIQNGRHEITKVIISSSIIEIETRLIHQTICFLYQRMKWNKRYIYLTSLSHKIQNGPHKITKVIISSSIIEIETKLFNQTICFSLSRNAIKECNSTNDTFKFHVIIMQIQNGRHEITKVSNSSLRIKKETMVFHQTMFSVSRNTIKKTKLFFTFYHAPFKVAAMKSINHIFIINWDRNDIILQNLMFSV